MHASKSHKPTEVVYANANAVKPKILQHCEQKKKKKSWRNWTEWGDKHKAGYKMLFLSTRTAIATHLLSLSVENIN